MGVLHFRYRERRRTLRVALALPIIVHGQNDVGEKFCVRATTRSINKQGAYWRWMRSSSLASHC